MSNQLTDEEIQYYIDNWGFNPNHVWNNNKKCYEEFYEFNHPLLSLDGLLKNLGVKIGARVIRLDREVQNRIVIKGLHESLINCVHTAVYQAPLGGISNLSSEEQEELAQSTEGKKINLPAIEHFTSLKSYVSGITEIGLETILNNYQTNENRITLGFNHLLITQLIKAITETLDEINGAYAKYAILTKKLLTSKELRTKITEDEITIEEAITLTIQEAYKELLINGWINKLKELMAITKMRPVVPEEIIQKAYEKLITNELISDFLELRAITQVKLRDKILQGIFIKYLEKGWINKFRKLREIIKVEPVILEETMQRISKKYLERGWLNKLKDLEEIIGEKTLIPDGVFQEGLKKLILNGYIKNAKNLSNWMGIKPTEELIQESYIKYLGKGWINEFKELEEITRIKPDKEIRKAYMELVQGKYMNYLRKGWINEFKKLKEAVDLEVDEEIVDEVGIKYLDEGWINKLKELMAIIRIKPVVHEETIQRIGMKYLGKGWINEFKELEEITRIKPTNETIQKIYVKYLESASHSNWWFKKFQELIETTMIEPNEEIRRMYNEAVQERYMKLLMGQVHELEELKRITGIEPIIKKEVMPGLQEKLKKLVKEGMTSTAGELISITGIKALIPEEDIQRIYKSLLQEGKVWFFSKLIKATNIKPSEEVVREGRLILQRRGLINALAQLNHLIESINVKTLN
ncbi:MAG: hypothetical protein ACTSYR_00155 [Candidatus Odinarchaeia archaeon]